MRHRQKYYNDAYCWDNQIFFDEQQVLVVDRPQLLELRDQLLLGKLQEATNGRALGHLEALAVS